MSAAGLEFPLPVALLGAITGMTYGILAAGLVLVYRSNRVLNFAHGEIGAFGAAVLGVAVLQWGLPYWIAFPLALGVGAGVAALSEVLVIRRLRQAPAVMSVIATLGLGQFLVFMSLVVNKQAASGSTFPSPPGLPTFDIGALSVTPAYSGMLFLTPVVVAGLVVFLRRSRFGLAIRAAADNGDAARMAGVFVSRMSSLAWAIAGAVSAFTAILVLPTRGFTSAEFLGPGLLLRALAAAVLARMTNLPLALAAGLGIGIVEQVLLWNYPRGGLVEAALFAIVLGALLLQRRRGGRTEEKGSWAAVQSWTPLPEALSGLPGIRLLGKAVALLAVLIALGLWTFISNGTAVILVVLMAFTIVGLSVGIVTGLSGQLSLGQFAVAGVGAVAAVRVSVAGGGILPALLAGGVVAAVASLLIGLPALRIKGLMLAVTTLGFALAAQAWLLQQPWALGEGQNPGEITLGPLTFDSGREYYLLTLGVLLAAFWVARNVWTGGVGRRLRAVRDNEDGARAFTVPATMVKLQGFVIAGFLAGLGGAIYAHSLSRVSADAFPIQASINAAAMAVLGGLGLLAGPLLGALYIVGVPQFVPLDNVGLAATALGWLMVVLHFPGGLAQALGPLRDRVVDWVAARHGLDAARIRDEDAGVAAGAGLPSVVLPAAGEASAKPASGLLLQVQGLAKHYGGIKAVDGVSFDVHAGETIGLIGPNGAGKTTLFELIGGFAIPDTGSVRYQGEDITKLGPEQRAHRGLIRSFQDASLFGTLTVLEALMLSCERKAPTRLAASMLGLRAAESRKEAVARDLAGSMGLHRYRHKQIRELSTGTRRITELACLLAMDPTILLLDEPSAGIAQRETEALTVLLRKLKAELGLTLIVVEHDMPMIMSLSDRIVAMDTGRVIAEGDPVAVRNDPVVVESYLGGDATAIERSGPGGPGSPPQPAPAL